jgi:tripartite-type tricarboxylate transporter receptor subunit TctC
MPHAFKRTLVFMLALGTLLAAGNALAQIWPSRAVRIVVPFAPGGGTDIQARLLGKKFQESMGQTFAIDNRAGMAGLTGADIVAKSPPDGYTLLFTTASLAVNVSLYQKISFDPVKDLLPVSWVSSVPLVLVVHPSVPARNVRDLIALAKRSAVRMNVASNGSGTTSHLSIEMLRQMAHVEVAHIPYKGSGSVMIALLSGEVDFYFGPALAVQPFIKQGKVRPLAVTTRKRSSAFPDLPTMDSIYPGFESDNWYAMFLPAGTPKEIVSKLNAEILKALKAPDLRDFITKEGGDLVGSSPEELAKYFQREVARYAKLIKAGNITVQ